MLLTPLLNELIAPENEPGDWSIVLWTHGIILLSTNLFFCIFASSKPASWTNDTSGPKEGNKIAPVKALSPESLNVGAPRIIVEFTDP